MSFISHNLAYYRSALEDLEQRPVTGARIYRAKQLLKFVDDIVDEGYTNLRDALERELGGVARLREYIRANGAEPFPVRRENCFVPAPDYAEEPETLTDLLNELAAVRRSPDAGGGDPFIDELRSFAAWTEEGKETAYVFLLRDTLLPYLWFRDRGDPHLYPWLIGRKMMTALTGEADADDTCIRSVIDDALEAGVHDYDELRRYCTPRIRENLKAYPALTDTVRGLLGRICQERIIVVESGVYGTFPMLLAALDERAEVRMFTAIPQMTEVYGDRIRTKAYEKNRWFETLVSQDVLFRYAGFENGEFLVRRHCDPEVQRRSEAEIRQMLR